MEPNDLPNDPHNSVAPNYPDSTLSSGELGGVTAGQIGPYFLLQVVGEGGMGEVWLAEQRQPIHRRVALKLIKAGMDTKAVVARFESERQALALMDHPNIARVFDAGSTAEGRPYFVMEYVPGLPITEYCDRHHLTIKERLGLFLNVCDGVQHAHQKAIIHRDLKPSNVLVVEQGNETVPKIIDFGLAKATAQRLTDKTMFTEIGVMIGTPECMSPEQADLREHNVDTRTDVYSLGVILYELLTSTRPFDLKQWRELPLHEVLRQIREVDPPPPSTRFVDETKPVTETAQMRKAEPHGLVRMLKRDLDSITMKALEKDRARRYESPSALAADVNRFLKDEPVLATPPSLGYRTRKFVKRHKAGVAVAAVVVILILLAVSMTVEAGRIARERDRANREVAAAENTSDFLIHLFNVHDLSGARGSTLTVREVLDQGANQIETQLSNQPEVQARLLETIGIMYESQGLYPQAQKLLEKSIEIRRAVQGPKNTELLRSLNELAGVLRQQGQLPAAEKVLRDAYATDRSTLGPEHPETLRALTNLGYTLGEQGRFQESEALLREALDLRRKVLGPDHPETLRTEFSLAAYLSIDNQLDEAEKLQRGNLEMRRHVLGDTHPDTLETMESLANTLQAKKHYAEAEKLRRDVVDVERRVLGPEHPLTLVTMNELANTLSVEGRYKEANALLQQTLEIQTRIRGANHPDTAETKYNMACNAALEGNRAEALALLKDAIEHGLSPLNKQHMPEDSDLESLHGNPEFKALVAEAQKSGNIGQKTDTAN